VSAAGRLVSQLWGADPERLWPFARRLVAPVTLWLAPSYAYGAERVPETGGGVVASNHLSAIDPPLVGALSPRTIYNMAKAELLALPVMTLATRGADGQPHAAPVYFVADGAQSLYFFSSGGSQHAHDLDASPKAAAAVFTPVQGWREIRGLQMRGLVRAVGPGPEWDRAWEMYLAKFPFAAEQKVQAMRDTLFVFETAWVRALDHARGFGYSDEWDAS
jgi:uncharacterized protein YhbP (UPF0306 family)